MSISIRLPRVTPTTRKLLYVNTTRNFTRYKALKMPEQLKQSEIDSKTDPSVAKQYEDAEGTVKFKDFYDLVDDMKIGIMGTYRKGVGV